MSTSEIIATILSLLTFVGGIVGKYIVDGLRERIKDLEAKNNSAVLQSRIDAIVLEIAKFEAQFEQRTKDKDRSDYEWRHGEYSNAITSINAKLFPLETKMEIAEKNIEGLRGWRHLVGDAYLPRAVDAIENRVTRLEKKVFNGDP